MFTESISLKGKSHVQWFFRIILFAAFCLLFTRLIELQIIKGEYYRGLSDSNRVRRVPITAPRGRVLARGGEILAENIPGWRKVNLSGERGIELGEKVTTQTDDSIPVWTRSYPLGSSASHIVGYLGLVQPDDLGKANPACPEKGIRSENHEEGKSGLELQYDCALRGRDGEELVEVDIYGEKIRTLGRRPPEAGRDIKTTIEYELQKKVSESLIGHKAAAVVTDSHGQVLALASNPSFDPDIFVERNQASISATLSDPALPLFNRAITGAYHPGSIFKIVSGAAALSEKAITSGFLYRDTGTVSVNGFDYTTWYFTQHGRVEGEQNFVKALSRSTDTFFYVIGQMVGIEKMVQWAKAFGVGSPTGVDLPSEQAGFLPTPQWKEKTLGEKWYLGNTFHFAIGQGDLTTTPLQANVLTSVIANGGEYCVPYINATDGSKNRCTKLPIEGAVRDEILLGMKMACETGGTGYPFFNYEPKVACKTGTAETGEKSPTHAWFTVFGPIEKPEIVVTVLVEKGGEGSKVAAPIAKKIFDYWFHERIKPSE